jgi:tetratricopeptide (TPR) repeat protein
MDSHRALALIREGKLEEAEELLRETAGKDGSWEAAANLGRLLEAKRSPRAALEWYETASARTKSKGEEARIQVRIAHCLQALGRDQEVRRVLEYALTLDPENLNARLELSRLAGSG